MQGSWGAGGHAGGVRQAVCRHRQRHGQGGRLKIDYLSAGAVVKPFEVQDAVNKGVLDMGHLGAGLLVRQEPGGVAVRHRPVLWLGRHHVLVWFYYGGGRQMYLDLMQKKLGFNIVGWFLMPMPTQPLGWFKKEPKSADDLKNLKYRTVGLATNVMQEMGCKVTQLPGGEIIPAMEKGVIDAFEYNNPTSDRRFGAADVAKVYMLSATTRRRRRSRSRSTRPSGTRCRRSSSRSSSTSVMAANSRNILTAFDQYPNDLQDLIHKDGVKVYRTPESILKAQLDAWDRVVAKYAPKCPSSSRSSNRSAPGRRTSPTTSCSTAPTTSSPTTTTTARSCRWASRPAFVDRSRSRGGAGTAPPRARVRTRGRRR